MNRRAILLAGGLLPWMSLSKAKAAPETIQVRWLGYCSTMDELATALKELPNRQELGNPSYRCDASGEPYLEVYAFHWFRPGDEAVAEETVARQVGAQISGLFADRFNGTIYWRIPLQWETLKTPRVVEYCDDGPDFDYVREKRCVMDKNWQIFKAYCRLTVAPNG